MDHLVRRIHRVCRLGSLLHSNDLGQTAHTNCGWCVHRVLHHHCLCSECSSMSSGYEPDNDYSFILFVWVLLT
jgi:hypothetical protein